MKIIFRKRILVPIILGTAVAIGVYQQQKISAAEHALNGTRAQIADVTDHISTAAGELQSFQTELLARRGTREQTIASVAELERELATADPESRWAEVPRNLPEWNAESPYIWVRKEVVHNISAEVFRKDGGLEENVAMVLAVDKRKVKALNAELARILRDYRKLESETVKLTDDHLPVNRQKDGRILTIQWEPPTEGAALKAEFESTLRQAVGEQRTKLLLEVDTKIENQFGQVGNPSNGYKITLASQKDGYLNIAVKQGSHYLSTGVPKGYEQAINQYVPPHLQPHFAELLKSEK